MYQFIESICCIDGELQLLDLHQARVNRTFFTNYGLLAKPIKLSRVIRQIPAKGKYKCRVTYNQNDYKFDFELYKDPQIKSLQVVEGGAIDYRFKYSDRNALDKVYASRRESDDILIEKQGMITDSYYANLAFFDGETWWTPNEPLLEGIRRQSLLDQGLIQKANITIKDLYKYKRISLFNAMLELGDIEVPIEFVND